MSQMADPTVCMNTARPRRKSDARYCASGYERNRSRLMVAWASFLTILVRTGRRVRSHGSQPLVYHFPWLLRFHICHVDAGSWNSTSTEWVTDSGGRLSVRILVL